MTSAPKPRSRTRQFAALLAVVCLGAGVGLFSTRTITPNLDLPFDLNRIQGAERPYGMAPVAFEAFIRACANAKIHPCRIGQTIGDAALLVGYHKRDGVLKAGGQLIDYTAAVDLGTSDLDRATIDLFLKTLTQQGFACWYREKGKWRGKEHIHAIYAQLPMKRQLRGQVREFLRDRRRDGVKPLRWERHVGRKILRGTAP